MESVIPRMDFAGTGQSASLKDTISFIVSDKGIKTGAFGFANISYWDGVPDTPAWGYVEFSKHADNYVTVKYYPETIANGFYIAQFILGESTWAVGWQRIQYNT